MNRMWKAAAALRFANRRRGSTLAQPPTAGNRSRRGGSAVPEPLESRVLMTYTQSTPVYTLTEPNPAAKDQFGHALVGVGGDVIVGSPLTKGTKTTTAGAVYRMTASTGALVGTYTRNTGGDEIGWSVAANANGDLAAGGMYATANGMTNVGVAASFDASTTNPNGLLTTPTALDPDPDPVASALYGVNIATSGNYVLVGCQTDNTFGSNVGGAFLYDRQGDLICKYYPPTNTANTRFGYSVGFLSNGNVVIGAKSEVNAGVADGSVYVMSGTATGTCRTALLHLADPGGRTGDSFGTSLTTSGTTIAVGAPATGSGTPNNKIGGAAYLFNGTTGALLQTFNDPTPSDSSECFGQTMALSGDGRLLISAPLKQVVGGYYTGQTMMYDLGTGAMTHVFNDPSSTSGGEFGLGLAFLGGNVAISAPTQPVGSFAGAGEVFVFAPTDAAPVANAGPNTSTPLGTPVTLSGAGSTDANGNDQIVSYAWDPTNSGTYSTPGQTLSFNPQAPGTYTVGLKVTDCYGLSSTTTVTVTVNDVAPTASVTGASAAGVGTTYTPQAAFTAPIANTSGYTVSWSFGDGATVAQHASTDPNALDPGHIFATAGTYTVTFTVYDPWGMSSSATTTVVVS